MMKTGGLVCCRGELVVKEPMRDSDAAPNRNMPRISLLIGSPVPAARMLSVRLRGVDGGVHLAAALEPFDIFLLRPLLHLT